MPRKRLVMFCGIPGSGKTTIGRRLSAKMQPSIFVQTDDIRSMLSKPSYSSFESRFVYSCLKILGRESLLAGYDTILEGTFPREEYRTEVLRDLSPLAKKALVVFVDCEPELAFGRNAGRKEVVPWQSFLRIYTQFEVPSDALTVDTSKSSPGECAERILFALADLDDEAVVEKRKEIGPGG